MSERAGSGATVWFTGLPGAGKTTLSQAVAELLRSRGVAVQVLDGDELRRGLNADLGFSRSDRDESVRRAAEVAALLAGAGIVTLVALVSPYEKGRERARTRHREAGLGFIEVWVSTPLAVCLERDPKGLYAKAQRGELAAMTGLDDPYECPREPEMVLPMHNIAVEEAAREVAEVLAQVLPVTHGATLPHRIPR